MREIKFRAWYENSQTWVYYSIGEYLDRGALKIYNKLCLDKAKWYQYTGLKDKNGKEIYDRDWILDNVGRKWVIKYSSTKAAFLFYYKGLSDPQPYAKFNKYQKPLEIIGNL